MTPTQRSVLARQPNKRFDGGWRDDGFWRVTMKNPNPSFDYFDFAERWRH